MQSGRSRYPSGSMTSDCVSRPTKRTTSSRPQRVVHSGMSPLLQPACVNRTLPRARRRSVQEQAKALMQRRRRMTRRVEVAGVHDVEQVVLLG